MSYSEYLSSVKSLLRELHDKGFVKIDDRSFEDDLLFLDVEILSDQKLWIVVRFYETKVFYYCQNSSGQWKPIEFSDFLEKISNPLFKQILLFNLDLLS